MPSGAASPCTASGVLPAQALTAIGHHHAPLHIARPRSGNGVHRAALRYCTAELQVHGISTSRVAQWSKGAGKLPVPSSSPAAGRHRTPHLAAQRGGIGGVGLGSR